MSNTLRSLVYRESDGTIREQKRHEVESRWRADRDERLRRRDRDRKRLERAERHTDLLDDGVQWRVGSTVRTVA